ncbi:hypothetical protein OROHE_015460 [Orobanche hederae]
MAWRGSVSRSLMSTARASAFRSSTPLSAPRRLRPPSVPSPRLNSRRFSFSNPRLPKSEPLRLKTIVYSLSACDFPVLYYLRNTFLDIRGASMRSITNATDGSKAYVLLGVQSASFLVLEHLVGTSQLVLDDDLGTWLIGAENSLFGEKVEIINKHRIMDIPVFVDETLISDNYF